MVPWLGAALGLIGIMTGGFAAQKLGTVRLQSDHIEAQAGHIGILEKKVALLDGEVQTLKVKLESSESARLAAEALATREGQWKSTALALEAIDANIVQLSQEARTQWEKQNTAHAERRAKELAVLQEIAKSLRQQRS